MLGVAALLMTAGCSAPDFDSGLEDFVVESAQYRYGEAEGIGYECPAIMHISDIHGDFYRLRAILNVARSSAHVVCNTGDDSNGMPGEDITVLRKDFSDYRAEVDASHMAVLGSQGNHDVQCTRAQYFAAMTGPMAHAVPGLVLGDEEGNKAYGYLDITPNDNTGTLRIIMLDPRDGHADPMFWWDAAFSQRQIDWLIATLTDARDRGIGVVTMMHYAFGDSQVANHDNVRPDIDFCQNTFMIPDIIDALQHGTALRRTYYARSSKADDIVVDIPEGEGGLDFVVHLFGHLHSKETYRCAAADGSRTYDILMLGEASLTYAGYNLDNAIREKNTAKDIAASLLLVDRHKGVIYRVSYGAYKTYNGLHTEQTECIPFRFRD